MMIEFDSTYDDGESVWVVGKDDNVLYRLNRDLGIEPVVLVSNEKGGYRETPNCIKHMDKIICLPDKGNKIVIYDLSMKKLSTIDVNIKGRTSILNAYMYKNALWCVSYNSGEVIKCNLESLNVEERFKVSECGVDRFNGEAKLIDNVLYLVDMLGSRYIEFDLDTQEIKIREVRCGEKAFSTISVIQNKVFLTGFNNAIYCCDSEKCSVISLEDKIKWLKVNKEAMFPRFCRSFVCGKYIVFMPLNSCDFLTDELLVLNTDNCEIDTYCFNKDFERQPDKNITLCYMENECICVHDEMLDEMTCIDLTKKTMISKKVTKERKNSFGFALSKGGLFQESSFLSLTDYLDAITVNGF